MSKKEVRTLIKRLTNNREIRNCVLEQWEVCEDFHKPLSKVMIESLCRLKNSIQIENALYEYKRAF